jgi:hypothetical protein
MTREVCCCCHLYQVTQLVGWGWNQGNCTNLKLLAYLLNPRQRCAELLSLSLSLSLCVLLSPSLSVLEFISTCGNIERETTKTYIVGILFEFLINLRCESGVCSALCWLPPFWYWSWNTRWGWGNFSTLVQTSHVHILRTLLPYKYMTRALQFVA